MYFCFLLGNFLFRNTLLVGDYWIGIVKIFGGRWQCNTHSAILLTYCLLMSESFDGHMINCWRGKDLQAIFRMIYLSNLFYPDIQSTKRLLLPGIVEKANILIRWWDIPVLTTKTCIKNDTRVVPKLQPVKIAMHIGLFVAIMKP